MVVNVLVELSSKNIDKTFDYLVPSNLESKIKVGKRVTVPFGKQTLEGFILGTNDTENENLKEIIDVDGISNFSSFIASINTCSGLILELFIASYIASFVAS